MAKLPKEGASPLAIASLIVETREFKLLMFVFTIFCILVLVFPARVVNKLEFSSWLRKRLIAGYHHAIFLTVRGPVFQYFSRCARRRGWFASKCCPPQNVGAEVLGLREVMLAWTPSPPEPHDAHHEEHYVYAWRWADSKTGAWQEEEVLKNVLEDKDMWDGKDIWGTVVGKLPSRSHLRFRICAVGVKGRSDWSDEVEVRLEEVPMSGSEDEGVPTKTQQARKRQIRYNNRTS